MADGCLNCRLLLSFICILNFLISITLKINQTWLHVSWFLIFIPIWIFNLISLCIIGYLILIKKWLQKKEKCLKIIYYLLNLLSSCAFEILLCIKLQYEQDMPYWIVFLPLWILMFFIFSIIIQQMYRTCQTTTEKTM
ncbi:unnamed protein product [Rotaria sp. Silwood2]|nr:unnamed protein product [Rotaria sp. Silwood2]CAF4101318.1 unnamed protein product [Rotaria sp. Silwood2]